MGWFNIDDFITLEIPISENKTVLKQSCLNDGLIQYRQFMPLKIPTLGDKTILR